MPRFQLSSQRTTDESDMPVRVIEHVSGRQSIIRSDIASIEVRSADGTIDKHKTYFDIGGMKLKEFEEMMAKPGEIDVKKLKEQGRVVKERRLLPE